jgi:hypothetical protein
MPPNRTIRRRIEGGADAQALFKTIEMIMLVMLRNGSKEGLPCGSDCPGQKGT